MSLGLAPTVRPFIWAQRKLHFRSAALRFAPVSSRNFFRRDGVTRRARTERNFASHVPVPPFSILSKVLPETSFLEPAFLFRLYRSSRSPRESLEIGWDVETSFRKIVRAMNLRKRGLGVIQRMLARTRRSSPGRSSARGVALAGGAVEKPVRPGFLERGSSGRRRNVRNNTRSFRAKRSLRSCINCYMAKRIVSRCVETRPSRPGESFLISKRSLRYVRRPLRHCDSTGSLERKTRRISTYFIRKEYVSTFRK